jgi:translation initiation factor IF-1
MGSGSDAPLAVPGRVVESLPNALYKVELLGEKRQMVTAHVAGSGRLLRLLPGDEVEVQLMAFDLSRGRIVRKRA